MLCLRTAMLLQHLGCWGCVFWFPFSFAACGQPLWLLDLLSSLESEQTSSDIHMCASSQCEFSEQCQ